MAKPHRCDVPGCGNDRRRWMRICEQCFTDLPRDVRTGIIENYRAGRKAEWKRFCRLAGNVIGGIKARRAGRVNAPVPVIFASPPCRSFARPTAEQAFANAQRLLGERD